MGGHLFTTPPYSLLTPRIPPTLYFRLLASLLALLRTHYAHAASPIPVSGKTSHGDIDILVCTPLDAENPLTPQKLAIELKAVAISTNSATRSFAVPWPMEGDRNGLPESGDAMHQETKPQEGKQEPSSVASRQEKFVQIDIHVCPTLALYHWQFFMQSHGDLWSIIGTSLRHFGLTATTTGLYVRIPEIEPLSRQRCEIFLTADPDIVLDFIGLEREMYWQEFCSLEEMFEYVAGMRWLRASCYSQEAQRPMIGRG